MLKLETEQVGRPEFPRWVIKDSHGRFFTGFVWVGNRKEALLFADRAHAEAERNKLQADNTPQMFDATVHLLIEVQTNAPISIDEIKAYMSRNARIEIDQEEGHDCSFANFQAVIDWNSLRS